MRKFGDIADVKIGMDDADFWIIRRGSINRVGEPVREYSPEAYGIRIKEEYLDRVLPQYMFYAMTYVWQQGYYRNLATGSTGIVNIRSRDIESIPISPME